MNLPFRLVLYITNFNKIVATSSFTSRKIVFLDTKIFSRILSKN